MARLNTLLLSVMVVLSIILIVTAFYGTAISLHRNHVVLPPYKQSGVETAGVIVDIFPNSAAHKDYGKRVIVEHRQPGGARSYRNWLKSPLTERLIHDPSKGRWMLGYESRYGSRTSPFYQIGDTIDIIYLPGDYDGRAVLRGDFDMDQQAIASGPIALAILWGLLLISLWITRSLIQQNRQNTVSN